MSKNFRRRLHWPLKTQLIIYFLLVALVPTITLSLFFSQNTIHNIKSSNIDTRTRTISQISDNVDKQAEWVETITNQIYLDTEIVQVLRRPPEDANRYDLQFQQTIEEISSQYQYTPVSQYLRAIIIEGMNGAELRFGPDSSMISLEQVKTSSWYMEGLESVYSYWGGVTGNYSAYSVVKCVVPIFVHLADPVTGKQLGHMLLFMNPTLFSDCYSSLITNSDGQIYLVKPDGNILSANSAEEDVFSLPPQTQKLLIETLSEKSTYPNPVRYFESSYGSVTQIVTYQISDATGWTLVEILPITQIQEQERLFLVTSAILVLVAAVLTIILSVFLSGSLTRPVAQMVSRVKQISQGGFYPAPESRAEERRDELSILGASIDQMQSDIDHLIQENIHKEKEKRIFEMQMLQTQINPHFLYGTLNTIKLMAAFQGAAGIEKMLVSLGRILRYSLGETREKVTLRDELGVLEEYIHIQKIHHKGKFDFVEEIPDESLLNCLVPRFILQPIAENAIQHGFQKIDGVGLLHFSVSADGDKLRLIFRDNGQGMTEEQLKLLRSKLQTEPQQTGSTKGGLGMVNVHSRIRLFYGEEYGLEAESAGPGQGAQITILLKLETGGETNEDTNH